jgi:hypothetical protein
MIIVAVVLAILLWSMSEIAWNEGRQNMAWVYLFLSAMNGAFALTAIF